MKSEEWDRIESEEERDRIRIQEAAYFLSIHRRKDGRVSDPDDDWLCAEWIANNFNAYQEFERALRCIVRDADPAQIFVFASTNLPIDMVKRTAIPYHLETLFSHFIRKSDVENVFAQSKTFGGLMLAFASLIRIRRRKA